MYFSEFLCRGRGCPQCSILDHCGEGHPNWQGGISEISEILRSILGPWKKEVLQLYNYQCDITKINSNNLVVHHLVNFSDLVQSAHSISNIKIKSKVKDYTEEEIEKLKNNILFLHTPEIGVVLDKEVHQQFHSVYGVKNNTPSQY